MNDQSEHIGTTEQSAPLSFAQQRLWLLDRLLPLGSIYNIEQVLRLSGELDHEALRGALNELLRRHEVLRTRLVLQNGHPMQAIAPEVRIDLAIEDLQSCGPLESENEARRRALAEAEAPFDLAEGPLIRARLFRLRPSEHWLILTLHHIVTDGWSSAVLARELSALYGAFCRGEPSPLPLLPVQYADYALWQRQWLQGAVLEQQLAYWRRALHELPMLELPTDRPRPATTSYRGGRVQFQIPESLTASLKELSRREGVTLFMTLLAVYQVLLFRYSGQEDLAVGVPIAGRSRRELEGLIGFFVNTLVLRGDLSGEPTFRTYLAQVRSRALDAYSHQDVPFEKLVEELAPKRDLSRNPLFQASLVLHNTPPSRWQMPGLDVERVEGTRGRNAKFDLAMSLTETGGKLIGNLEHATDLFDAGTIERMVGHWQVLLEGIVADPEQPISHLPLLTPTERHQLLVQWNDTAVDYPRDRCIHQLFEEQVARTPDRVAVVFEDRQLSYAELNARANQLAHYLRSKGVGPDVLVGICVERSPDMVAGLLGILKAGGAYVPLDPSYPMERLAFMLEDTQAPVLLMQKRLLAQLPPYEGHILCLDRDGKIIAAQPDSNPPATATASNLAYVIYTSGSTGRPKGVMIEHHSTVSLLCWVRAAFADEELSGMLCTTSICFDLSIFELFGALCWGGKAILVESALDLATCRHRHQVTLVNTVPSIMQTVLETQALPDSVVTVNLAGEPLREALADALHALGHVRRVNDLYGPSETTTYSTSALRTLSQPATIGKPLANTQVYLLDTCLNPVPIGVTGELCIGGEGVARGYLNRPELTAERFIPDPFSDESCARLYRTGDLARYRPGGSIELLGRADSQVKLRGFRIELGEIEVVLGRHPKVREAVVVAREDAQGDKRLVAYVVARDGDLAIADLRALLERQVPHYMVPAAFVLLPALPLTANGKVDRRALPIPPSERGELAFDMVAPRDNVELHLTKIWEDVLNVRSVGIRDNFFDIGGHSLLAVQLMDRIERAFHRRLPLDTLWFYGGTIEALARMLRDKSRSGPDPELVLIKKGSRQPLFVAHTMGGNLFHYYDLAHHLDAEQTVFGLQARGVYGSSRPDDTIEAVASHCIESMRKVQPRGPYLVAGYSSGGVVAFDVAQQLAAAGQQVAMLALLDTYAPKPLIVRSWIKELARLRHGNLNFRQIQELAYYSLLHPLSMGSLRQFRSVGEAHRWAHWSYRLRPYAHPIELFLVKDSEVRAGSDNLGWARWASDSVRIHRLPGNHGDLVKPPVVTELAALLQARIDGAVGK